MLFDPERRWSPRGICRPEDHHLFFAEGGTPGNPPGPRIAKRWAQAKEICAMCPVAEECKRDSLGEEYGVFGGVDQYERSQIRRRMSRTVRQWPEEKRLAWGRQLTEMRAAGVAWKVILLQTGLNQAPAEYLIAFFEENAPKAKKQGAVTDVPLPGDEPPETPFPERPGRRHAWVRHRGGISDAWYRGETPDGKWISVTTYAGRGQVHKWLSVDDVQLYRPQAVVILNYTARPDRDEHTPAA